MHYLDQGNKNRIIVKSQIPNQHLLVSMKKTLQGTFELINSFFVLSKLLNLQPHGLGNQTNIDKQYYLF